MLLLLLSKTKQKKSVNFVTLIGNNNDNWKKGFPYFFSMWQEWWPPFFVLFLSLLLFSNNNNKTITILFRNLDSGFVIQTHRDIDTQRQSNQIRLTVTFRTGTKTKRKTKKNFFFSILQRKKTSSFGYIAEFLYMKSLSQDSFVSWMFSIRIDRSHNRSVFLQSLQFEKKSFS